MRPFNPAARAAVIDVAARTGFSEAAGVAMAEAIRAGHGRMAQFDHPEFGGRGQWMTGGMTMLSGPFDAELKARVGRLCDELAALLTSGGGLFPGGADDDAAGSADSGSSGWWPAEFGRPNASGSQNDVRYAYFANVQRLAIERGGRVTVYDTEGRAIEGVSQQQPGSGSLAFATRRGTVDLGELPLVSQSGADGGTAPGDVLATIERLASLRERGILSEREFEMKKAELLRSQVFQSPH